MHPPKKYRELSYLILITCALTPQCVESEAIDFLQDNGLIYATIDDVCNYNHLVALVTFAHTIVTRIIIPPPEKCFVAQPALVILVLNMAKWTNTAVDTLNHSLQLWPGWNGFCGEFIQTIVLYLYA